jgi:hypothetical protein
VRTNDEALRDLLREAKALFSELEGAIARHDATAERVLAYKASHLFDGLQGRISALGTTHLGDQL